MDTTFCLVLLVVCGVMSAVVDGRIVERAGLAILLDSMIVSRVISISAKPLMSALKLRTPSMVQMLAVWRRHIATDGNQFQRQSVSGSQDERLLDPFIGRWTEISCEGFKGFLEAASIPKDQQVSLLASKLELVYSKMNNKWKIESRFQNTPEQTAYTFKIGEKFQVKMSLGPVMNCKVTQDGGRWLENYESVTKPLLVMNVTNEVNGDQMTSVTTLKDSVVKRVFARQ